jgi:glyoxylase-like metal-dependent hydrolase (beta-lactamase superfamily II)
MTLTEERRFGPLWILPGPNGGHYPHCHTLFIEGDGVVIDPGSDRERLIRLRDEKEVRAVWLSHAHEDHFMHLDLFDDLPLYVSEQDAPALSDIEHLMDAYGIERPLRDHWRPVFEKQFHFNPRRPAGFLKAHEIMTLREITVQIIPAPGHTPGHRAFLFREPEVLFLGDYDLTRFGPWYGDRGSSIEETRRSVEMLRSIPAKVWLTAHGTGVYEENPGKLWDRFVDVIQSREEKLLDVLTRPSSFQEIVESYIIYGRRREPWMFYQLGEAGHMKKHLNDLINRQIACEEDGVYRLC